MPTEAEQYELAAAAWMRQHGFPDAKVTPPGADAGIDVRATGAVAQVKAWNHKVGRPELQRLKGASSPGQKLFFFAKSGFTTHAEQYAAQPAIDMKLVTLTIDTVAARNQQHYEEYLRKRGNWEVVVGIAIVIVVFLLCWNCIGNFIDSGSTKKPPRRGGTFTLTWSGPPYVPLYEFPRSVAAGASALSERGEDTY